MRKIFCTLALAAASLFAVADAYAQCNDLPPVGSRFRCYFVNGGKVLVPEGSGAVPANSTGFAEVEVIYHNFNPCEAVFGVRGFSSTGTSPQLGLVRSNLAPGGSPDGRLTGSGATTLFPASLQLNLNINVEADALPGRIYNGVLSLQAQNITSVPFVNVNATQTAPLTLVAPFPEEPDGVSLLILSETNVILNGEGQPPVD